MRDWFPLSALGPFSDLVDHLMGERADWGAMKCGCHPNCGIGTVLMVNKKTHQMVPLTQFLDMEGLLDDIGTITDGAQAKPLTVAQLALALAKNYRPEKAPPGYTFAELLKQLLSQTGARGKKIGEYEIGRRRVRVARAVRRRHVVPGSVQLRLPPHRDVHHPVRHADGRDQLLRLQHRRRLAQHRREDAAERDRGRVVQEHGRHAVYAKGQDFPMPEFGAPITARLDGEPVRLRVLST